MASISSAKKMWLFALTLPAICLCGAGLAEIGIGVQGERIDPSNYWQRPLAPQGSPPAEWTALEQSLAPEDCRQCHMDQFQQWRRSRHAQAFSPGLVGQLLNFDTAVTAECMQCHAPLAEQLVAFEAARTLGVAHVREQQGLAAAGNGCGGCHLRQHEHFGPPQRGTGAIGPSSSRTPHGGVVRVAFFESSEFCRTCHQHSAESAINGKPLENTYAEWKASPQADQGITCQGCHMPDRQHSWAGIHDPAMVVSGVTARTSVDRMGARFVITNTGTGHAFPTYAAPSVVMHAVALDSARQPRLETMRSHIIARRMRYQASEWTELSDTRLMPGQSAAVEIAWNGSDWIRVWLEVVPDYYYESEVYHDLLQALPHGSEAAQLIANAQSQAEASRFSLFETELQRP